MLKKILFILPLFLHFCADYNKNEIPPISDDEYKVFSYILDENIRRDSIKVYLDTNTIAFYKNGVPLGFFDGPTVSMQKRNRIKDYYDYFFASSKFNEIHLSRSSKWKQFNQGELLKDLLIKNTFSFKINVEEISLKKQLVLVRKYDSRRSFETRAGEAPRIGFSRVGFDNEFTQAIVYVSLYCGLLCASWDFYLLRKIDFDWQIIEKINIAVS